jgi:hypothetical protein
VLIISLILVISGKGGKDRKHGIVKFLDLSDNCKYHSN